MTKFLIFLGFSCLFLLAASGDTSSSERPKKYIIHIGPPEKASDLVFSAQKIPEENLVISLHTRKGMKTDKSPFVEIKRIDDKTIKVVGKFSLSMGAIDGKLDVEAELKNNNSVLVSATDKSIEINMADGNFRVDLSSLDKFSIITVSAESEIFSGATFTEKSENGEEETFSTTYAVMALTKGRLDFDKEDIKRKIRKVLE